jgi:RNA polymerase sigma-70 factor, ECF subfamily
LADLMSMCAAGDEAAFTELYDLTLRRVYGTVLRVLRSPEHAEEVTQEVYVDVWRQAPRYALEKGSVMGWIATMAHRRAVDRVRSVSSEIARDERYAYSGQEREGDEVWESVAQQHDVERVRGAIATLTPIQQQAVQLAYYGGLSQSQISDALHLPIGTVKTRIRDGLRRLAAALGGAES